MTSKTRVIGGSVHRFGRHGLFCIPTIGPGVAVDLLTTKDTKESENETFDAIFQLVTLKFINNPILTPADFM